MRHVSKKNHAFGEFYYVRWSHVDPRDGKNVWLDKYGNETKVYSEDDRVMIGKNSVAPWSGGLSSTLSWKGLQLDVQFTGMFGPLPLQQRTLLHREPDIRYFEQPDCQYEEYVAGSRATSPTSLVVNSEVHSDTLARECFVRASEVLAALLQLAAELA